MGDGAVRVRADLAPTSCPGRLFDPRVPIFDSDRGVYKGRMCSVKIDLPFIDPIELNTHKWHYRVYAPEGVARVTQDRIFNLSLAFYVIGTSHQDHNDSRGGPLSGGLVWG